MARCLSRCWSPAPRLREWSRETTSSEMGATGSWTVASAAAAICRRFYARRQERGSCIPPSSGPIAAARGRSRCCGEALLLSLSRPSTGSLSPTRWLPILRLRGRSTLAGRRRVADGRSAQGRDPPLTKAGLSPVAPGPSDWSAVSLSVQLLPRGRPVPPNKT